MKFIIRFKDYLSELQKLEPYQASADNCQLLLDNYLDTQKGSFGEYSLDVFEEALRKKADVTEARAKLNARKEIIQTIEAALIPDLMVLKDGKLKITMENTAYLLSLENNTINLMKAFE
jgi:hypothetical protein